MGGGYSVAAVLCVLTPALLLVNRIWAISIALTGLEGSFLDTDISEYGRIAVAQLEN